MTCCTVRSIARRAVALGVCVALTAISLAPPAGAAVFTYVLDFEITSYGAGNLAPEIAIGDVFRLQFDLDHSAVDTDPDPQFGTFAGLTSNWSLSRLSGTGTWNLAGGTLSPGGGDTRDDVLGEDTFGMLSLPSGFGTAGGGAEVFSQLTMYFVDQTQTAVNDTGIGQSLAAILGGPFDGAAFPYQPEVYLVFSSSLAIGTIGSIQRLAVPEPSSLALALAGLTALGLRRPRRRPPTASA